MNKIKYLIIPILSFVGIFLCNENVSATAYETLKIEPQPNVYYAMTGDDGYFSADPFSYYTMDGKTVYCVEQGVPIYTQLYIGVEGFSASPFSNEINRKIELIGHYGYDYPSHQTLKYRMATQALIWETITGYNVNFYTENYGWGDYIDVSYEREQIMNLVNNHHIKPSFDSQVFNINLNETIEIDDFNNKLSEFQIYDSNGNDVRIDNNKIFITAKTIGQSEILFRKKYYDNATTFFYRADDGASQKVAFFRTKDPVLTYFNINVVGGKIKIKKVDSETNLCKSSGDASLKGAKYGVYDSNNNLVETLTIGDDCSATTDYLPFGNYKIKELSASTGYEIDTNIYEANIVDENIVEIISKENIIKGKIRIKKFDSETNSCKAQGNAILKGAKYGIYDSSSNLVETLTIGNDCTATSKSLPVGNYKIKELSVSTGYEIDTNVYEANITNENIVEIISKENIIKGKIRIKKVDSEINSCKAQGQASLIGAKYGVYDSNNNLVDTLIIGDDCTATSKYLPYSKYQIREISAPVGYELDKKVYDVNIDVPNIIDVISNEKVIKGKIKLKKVDSETNFCKAQGQASLIGAKYGVYDSNNNLVDTLIIGDDCTATSKYLPYSKYQIREISAPIGYEIDTKVYEINITDDTIVEVASKENVIKGKIKIKKVDSETNSCKSQGQASLIGAKYGVYDSSNNLIETLTISDDCSATTNYLPYGNYKIKELSASTGYEIDTNIYDASIINTNIIEITSKERVIKNFISILKQYDFVDGNTTFLNAESGITFEIYSQDNILYDTIITDKNGYATLEIPYGVWRFHQVNTHAGFEKIYDFYIIVDENSESEQYYNILNNKLSAYLKVVKVDSETCNTIAIADTTFKILNTDTNQYVSQYVGGKVYSEFKTDSNGVMTTYLKLESGNYKLIEVSSPHNYLINNDGLEFSIGKDTYYNYTAYGAFVTVYFSNQVIKGQIEVNKNGENIVIENGNFTYQQKPLENVVFEIYANEDILSADGNFLYYEKDQLVDTITTNKDGYAISKQLYLGSYYIIETKTNDAYVLDNKKYEFTLTEEDNKTPIVYHNYSALNVLKKSKLEFTKTDVATAKGIPDTKIEIYHLKADGNSELIFTGITDEDGKIIINNFFIGKFTIIETNSATGYKLSDEIVSFEIKENGEIVKANMTNEKIKSTIKIHKVDEENNSLSGVEIGIFDLDDNLLNSYITDENGDIELELEYGSYYFQEIKTIDGHILNDEKVYFDINKDGEYIQYTLVNETETIEVPNTKLNDCKFLDIIGLILIIAGVSYIIYDKKRKK